MLLLISVTRTNVVDLGHAYVQGEEDDSRYRRDRFWAGKHSHSHVLVHHGTRLFVCDNGLKSVSTPIRT